MKLELKTLRKELAGEWGGSNEAGLFCKCCQMDSATASEGTAARGKCIAWVMLRGQEEQVSFPNFSLQFPSSACSRQSLVGKQKAKQKCLQSEHSVSITKLSVGRWILYPD